MNRLEIGKLEIGSRIAQVIGKVLEKKDGTTEKGVRWMNIILELFESKDTIPIVFFYAMVDKYINILNIGDLIDIQDAEVKHDSYSGRNLTVRSDTVITTKDHDHILPKTKTESKSDSNIKVLPTAEQTGEDLYGKQEHKDPKPFKHKWEEPNDEPNDEEVNHRGFYPPNHELHDKSSLEKQVEDNKKLLDKALGVKEDVYGRLEYRSEISEKEAKQINKEEAHRQLEEELEDKEYYNPNNPYTPFEKEATYTTNIRDNSPVIENVFENKSHVKEIERITKEEEEKAQKEANDYDRQLHPTHYTDNRGEKYKEQRKMTNENKLVKYEGKKELIIPLNMESVRKFFPGLKKCSDEEIGIALHKCTLHELDPMRDEVYLIPYTNQKTGETTVRLTISIDTWLARANEQPDFDGTESGIVVRIPKDENGRTWERREGALLFEGEVLLGAYAIVYKKKKRLTFRSISFKDFKGITHFWRDMPAIMIEKTALSLCLRKAYPVAFKGLYSQAELDQMEE